MDTSKQYKVMSDYPLIQDKTPSRKNIHFFYNKKRGHVYQSFGRRDDFSVWLPMQHEIQELMPGCRCGVCLTNGLHNFVDNNIDGFFDTGIEGQVEKFWLCYYMHEKHKLIWKNNKWLSIQSLDSEPQ